MHHLRGAGLGSKQDEEARRRRRARGRVRHRGPARAGGASVGPRSEAPPAGGPARVGGQCGRAHGRDARRSLRGAHPSALPAMAGAPPAGLPAQLMPALAALYGTGGPAASPVDAAAQRTAERWLVEFQGWPDAWEVRVGDWS